QLLLPFTKSQLAAVQERAVARIARLANFITSYPELQVCPCFVQATVLRHGCSRTRFAMLGRLLGHLTLCCTCLIMGIHQEAVEALYHLHTFILQQISKCPWLHHTEQLQLREGWQARRRWQRLQIRDANEIFLMFVKYLQPSDQVDIILMAINSFKAQSSYSISIAARMVDVLVEGPAFQPGQVLNIVWAIYRNLPSINTEVALNSLDRALLVLMGKYPSEVVTSLLQCSPTCNRVATAMWRVMLTKSQAASPQVLQELLRILMNQSLRKTSTSTKDNPRFLSLAVACMISEILLQPTCLQQVKAVFPQLFLVLLFQVSFITELTLQEVCIFWKEHQQDMCTPIRSAVKSMRVLLCIMGFESQVLDIKAEGGWDALLSAQTHLMGVRIVAREMMKTPRPLPSTIFCHLVEFLRMEDPTWEMIAMVFLIEMLGCTDLSEELDSALEIFPIYLRSQCLGMPSLVLRGILGLTQRPDTARKALVLLPYVMQGLQGADSDTSAVALPVLGNMLQLLEGKTLSITALALAEKLQPLFNNELDTVRELSIHLFQNTMGLVVGAEKQKMKKVVWDSLLPLLFHLHDQDKNVVKASQEALCSAGRFLKWRQLAQLAETTQAWRISECLLARKKSRAKDYLNQSQFYLQSPQETLRREAVRFI
ncbi:MROH7 protein, partial [Fregetta grallaria]|nr:MROH7 protein [Fregetta grallaria]